MSDSWLEITCEISTDLSDILADYLTELSGAGVCTENLTVDAFSHSEIIHPPSVAIKAYFPDTDDMEKRMQEIRVFLERLASRYPDAVIVPPVLSTVRSEDWSTSWKANFKPLKIGRRLLVVPTWEKVNPRPEDIVLRLDPGMAFGTGGHETTRLCLEILEEVMDGMPLMISPSVLDLGTGSGILAMAAVRLGAGRVCAVDIDPQAIEVARENLALNQLVNQVECSTTPLEALNGVFDVILANILAEELVRLAPHLMEHVAPGGTIVLSGILSEKEMLVRNGFASQPAEYRETRRLGEWVALVYQRHSS